MNLISTAAWIIGSIVGMSFIEHQVHRQMMHRKFGLLSKLAVFQKVFENHAILHHGHYHDSFTDEPVPPGEDHGIRLSIKEGFFEALPIAAVLACFSLQGGIIFVSVVCVHHFLWGKIHLEQHKPEGRWFSRLPLFKFLARHHYLHHKYPGRNFNVVFPIADYVLRTNVHASAGDFADMRRLGLLAPLPVAESAVDAQQESVLAHGKKR